MIWLVRLSGVDAQPETPSPKLQAMSLAANWQCVAFFISIKVLQTDEDESYIGLWFVEGGAMQSFEPAKLKYGLYMDGAAVIDDGVVVAAAKVK